MKIMVKRKDSTLIPVDPLSEKEIFKLKDKTYSCTIKESRNPKHHNLVFGLAKFTVDNCHEESVWSGKDPYSIIKAIQLEVGSVEYIQKFDGEIIAIPKSIAFENMDEDEFSHISDALFFYCAKILDIDQKELMINYQNFLGGHI